MANHYVVTAHRPTAVTACLTGYFLNANQINLVVAKNTTLEVFTICPEGLKPIKEIVLNGKVAVMKSFRMPQENKDFLFIVTFKYNAMILEFVIEDGTFEVLTKAWGDVADRIGKPSETGILAVVDPNARIIGLRLYDGLFKVIQVEKDSYQLKATNFRMDELQVHDIEFLHGCVNPTIILIHQDVNGRHVKTHEISLREKEFMKVPWRQDNVETEASIIIPIPSPYGGAVIIGQENIAYHNGTVSVVVAPPVIKRSTVTCYAKIDHTGLRYLLGDMAGHLFMTLLETECKADGQHVIKNVEVELLGEIAIPECITYLDNGVLFIGSRLGDSQLIKLNTMSVEDQSYVMLLDTFTNLGPIVDMCVVDLERQGQGQLVTCSGAYKEGTLRIIRNGIGIHEKATFDLDHINGMWPLQIQGGPLDDALVCAFVTSTMVISIDGDDIERIEIEGFTEELETYYSGNVIHDNLLQVTKYSARLVSRVHKYLIVEWKPPNGQRITVVDCNGKQIVASTKDELYYVEIRPNELFLRSKHTLKYEVACIDISPLRENEYAEVVAIGLWIDVSAQILNLPDLTEIHSEPLGGDGGLDNTPRSILMVNFEGHDYLLVTLADGCMYYFIINLKDKEITRVLTDKKKVILGTQPTRLRTFKSLNSTNVFACSDRPTVIYSSNHKLVFSNVNLRDVRRMSPFNGNGYLDSLVLATEDSVTIGTIDEMQKLHIKTVPLEESPRRIAHQECNQIFGVLTCQVCIQDSKGCNPVRPSISTSIASVTVSSNVANLTSKSSGTSSAATTSADGAPIDYGQEVETHHLLIIDQNTFDGLHCHKFMNQEYAMSLISCSFANDPNTYFVVGTAIVNPEESEPKQGRIVVFQWTDKLVQISEKEIKGACYSLAEFNGKLLASINSTVRLFEWTNEKELRLECSHFNNIVSLSIKTKGEFILVGDLMRSMTLLQYKTMTGGFDEVARDYNPNWMTSLEFLDDDIFLGAENCYNMFVCQKDSTAATDDERTQLTQTAHFHFGDMINVFRHGSLVMQNVGETSIETKGCVLFGTVGGAIGIAFRCIYRTIIGINGAGFLGLVTTIAKPACSDFLRDLEAQMSCVIKPIGRIDQLTWRSFNTDVKTEPSEGFIDGDLIERFLDLSPDKMKIVANALHLEVEEIVRRVEDLTRIH